MCSSRAYSTSDQMDFTFLIIVVLMLLAAQSNNLPIVIALFALLLVSAKSKLLIFAAIVGLGLALFMGSDFENKSIYILGGLFLILVLIAKSDTGAGAQAPYMGGGYY